ncbi:hypothetical protein HZB04_02470 [Candidatus Wolfebacteria bacterium]|nr:hypothetical protein [Candidatus Wolfebacteria bacterium]
MKKILIFIVFVLSMAVFSSVKAIGLPSLPGNIPASIKENRENINQERKDIRENIKQERQDIRSSIKETREGVKQGIKEERQEIKEARQNAVSKFQQKREEAKKIMEQKKEEFKNTMEAKKVEAKKVFEEKRAELKNKLLKVKDEKKKVAVEKINNEIAKINENRMNHFSEALNKLEKVLANIGSRADKAESNGRDISAVKTAITGANSAIAESRTAISAQSGKTYVIAVNTEETLRQDVGKTRQELQVDLDKVRDTVEKAKQAVHNAAVILAQIPKVDERQINSTATTTSTTTP